MPYKKDPRRKVTLNFQPPEYAQLAAEALAAGYATPGAFAQALVRARGTAPPPVLDPRSARRVQQALAELEEEQDLRQDALEQLQTLEAQVQALTAELRATRRTLAGRLTDAQIKEQIAAAITAWEGRQAAVLTDCPVAAAPALPAPAPVPEPTTAEKAAARQRRVKERERREQD